MATTPVIWDSFNSYAAPAELGSHFALSGTAVINQDAARSRTGDGSLVLAGASGLSTGATLTHAGMSASYVVVNSASYLETAPTFARAFLELRVGANTKARVIANTDGTLRLDVGTTSVATSTVAVTPGGINYFELIYRSDASAGILSLYLGGVEVVSFTGDTVGSAGNVESVIFRGAAGSTSTTAAGRANLSDVVVATVTGTPTAADARLGAVTHSVIVPTSDVTVAGTPSTGTDNFAMVDEVPNDGDTTYVELAAPADADLYGHSSTLAADTTPLGVAVFSHQRLPDGGTTQVRARINNSTTTANGTDTGVGGTYAVASHFWEQSPFTTAAWTKAEVEALRFGVEARV